LNTQFVVVDRLKSIRIRRRGGILNLIPPSLFRRIVIEELIEEFANDCVWRAERTVLALRAKEFPEKLLAGACRRLSLENEK
jgi:hypothetical protein